MELRRFTTLLLNFWLIIGRAGFEDYFHKSPSNIFDLRFLGSLLEKIWERCEKKCVFFTTSIKNKFSKQNYLTALTTLLLNN